MTIYDILTCTSPCKTLSVLSCCWSMFKLMTEYYSQLFSSFFLFFLQKFHSVSCFLCHYQTLYYYFRPLLQSRTFSVLIVFSKMLENHFAFWFPENINPLLFFHPSHYQRHWLVLDKDKLYLILQIILTPNSWRGCFQPAAC